MKSKGFTLIELIVVMAVFLLIIGTALAIFISIVQHQKRILAKQELLNQTSYAIEYMTKGLRMAGKDYTGECIKDEYEGAGYVYKLTHYNNGAYGGIKFVNQSDNNACQEFFLDNSILMEAKNGGDAVPVTSLNLEINSLNFVLNGDSSYGYLPSSEIDNVQPRVTVSLDVEIQGDNNQPATKVQTTVSQRDLNK